MAGAIMFQALPCQKITRSDSNKANWLDASQQFTPCLSFRPFSGYLQRIPTVLAGLATRHLRSRHSTSVISQVRNLVSRIPIPSFSPAPTLRRRKSRISATNNLSHHSSSGTLTRPRPLFHDPPNAVFFQVRDNPSLPKHDH